jgi:hypothetical protein
MAARPLAWPPPPLFASAWCRGHAPPRRPQTVQVEAPFLPAPAGGLGRAGDGRSHPDPSPASPLPCFLCFVEKEQREEEGDERQHLPLPVDPTRR